jgi:hypothetical protein
MRSNEPADARAALLIIYLARYQKTESSDRVDQGTHDWQREVITLIDGQKVFSDDERVVEADRLFEQFIIL